MATEIYLVSEGEYSDYSICAVFSTKELADAYIATTRSEKRIEVYWLDEPQEVWKDCVIWIQHLEIDTGEDCRSGSHTGKWMYGPMRGVGEVKLKERHYFNDLAPRRMAIGMSRISEEHAMKIAVEARQRYLRDKAFQSFMLDENNNEVLINTSKK